MCPFWKAWSVMEHAKLGKDGKDTPLRLFRTSGLEPESCVVGGPAALVVAQHGSKTGRDVTQILIPFRRGKRIAESVGQ